jgi:hypothetical protein
VEGGVARVAELAQILLLEEGGGEGAFAFGEEFGRDAGAIEGGGAEIEPAGLGVVPEVVVEAGAVARGGEDPDAGGVPGGGEGAGEGVKDGVGDEGGFVEDGEGAGVAADGGLAAGEGADFRAVRGVLEVVLAALEGADGFVELLEEGADLFDDFAGLGFGAGEDEDLGVRAGDEVMGGLEGDDGGFAGLAGAVEDDALVVGGEGLFLPGVEGEGHVALREFAGVEEREGVVGFHLPTG